MRSILAEDAVNAAVADVMKKNPKFADAAATRPPQHTPSPAQVAAAVAERASSTNATVSGPATAV